MAFGKGRVARFLAYRPFILLGEISFSLYLVHQLLARVVVNQNTVAKFGHPHLQYLAFWVVALGLSYLLWVLVEKPAQRRLSGWFDRWLGSRGAAERVKAPVIV
jgi:peptidoglycan/LPS O-acetylase OafA/YrhL